MIIIPDNSKMEGTLQEEESIFDSKMVTPFQK